jgi:hypothetical protein
MIRSLSAKVQWLASWQILAITGIAFAAFAAVLFATSLPFSIPEVTALCGSAPPDVRPYTSGEELGQFLLDCGASGRDAYRNLQLADLLYPAVSGLFLASALAMTLTRIGGPGSRIVALAVLPLIGGAFDYVENAASWVALVSFPLAATPGHALLGVASAAKQAASWAGWLVLLAALGYLLARAARRHQGPAPVSRRATARTGDPRDYPKARRSPSGTTPARRATTPRL